MHLIQQRQVQDLFEDITQLKVDTLSGRNYNYDFLNADQTLGGKKTFTDDATFEGKMQIQTIGLGFDFSLSGDAYIAGGEKFYYGNTNLYTYAQTWNRLVVAANAAGASGQVYLESTSGIVLAAPFLDLTNTDPEVLFAQSATALKGSVGGVNFLTLDTNTTSDIKLGFGHTGSPRATLDITGAQLIDSNNTSSRVLTIGNSGGSEMYVAFNNVGGESRVGVGSDGYLSGFYLQANDNMPLYLGHVSNQAIRIDSTGSRPRVRIGEHNTLNRPAQAASSVLEIHNTGDAGGPIVTLYNDKTPSSNSNCAFRFVEDNDHELVSWALGHHDDAGLDSSFRLAYGANATAALGTNDQFIVSGSVADAGMVKIAGGAYVGSGLGVIKDATIGEDLNVTGAVFLNFGTFPSSDPGVKGAVWRDGADLKVSI